MRIKKNSTTVEASANPVKANDYTECLRYIKAAIDSLGGMNNRDDKVKDAIANLGVVYFDLK